MQDRRLLDTMKRNWQELLREDERDARDLYRRTVEKLIAAGVELPRQWPDGRFFDAASCPN